MIEVSAVPSESITRVWAEILPMIERGLAHGQGDGTTSNHMLAAILRGDMTLWVIHQGDEILAGVILSVRTNDTGKKLYVNMLAGRDMDLWASTVENLLRDCRDLVGAKSIEASCRRGLARRLTKRGWKNKAMIMEIT